MENRFISAFPHTTGHFQPEPGMSERSLIAAIAMNGLLSNPNGAMTKDNVRTFDPDKIAALSLMHTDALLTELSKATNNGK